MITIGYSTRSSKPELQEYFKKTCGIKNAQIIEKVNSNGQSLTDVYNDILNESENDIVVLCHDDIYFDNKSWGFKILEHFKKTDYGILGVAGSTSLPKSGMWWEDRRKMVGIVNHEHKGKKWESKYSNDLGNKIHQTVLIDGLFMVINKSRIKENFDTDVKGFHLYDVDFCFRNYIKDVKIGVLFNIRITHKSIGMTNDSWEENRKTFSKRYKDILPIKLVKTLNNKLKVLFMSLKIDNSEFVGLIEKLNLDGHSVSVVSNFNEPSTSNIFKKSGVKIYNLNEPPGFKLGDGKWLINTPEGKVVSQENNLYKISEINFDLIVVKDTPVVNHSNSLYPEIEKLVLNTNDSDPILPHISIKKTQLISETSNSEFISTVYNIINSIDENEVKQKIKILSGHSEKGGSTTAFINLTNELNSKGFDTTFYGPHVWHLNKCQSGMLNDVRVESDDIVICHFLRLEERPKAKKVILSIHEKNLFELSNVKQYWDEVVFLHEGHRDYHKSYEGPYSLIPNLKEPLDKVEKPELDLIAGVIGTIDENKQTHVSIQRAINDGCEKVIIFGSVSDPNYYDSKVKPLLSDKVINMGHVDSKQTIYNMIGRVYHSSISEVACLIKDECYTTGIKFFGNESTSHQVSNLTNDEIIEKWNSVFDL
jgi:hypothetical protein